MKQAAWNKAKPGNSCGEWNAPVTESWNAKSDTPTSLRRDMRAWVVQLGLDYGARVSIVALPTPVSLLMTRNRKREHPVPSAVLQRQLDSMEWPTPDEAHELVVVRGV